MKRSLTNYAKESIKEIHALSSRHNGAGCDHSNILLKLLGKHAGEIKELHGRGNEHFIVETGDLLVLCLEFLAEYGKDPDDILEICYTRYRDKLTDLIKSSGPKK